MSRRATVLLLLVVSLGAFALTLSGRGTITPQEQRAVDAHVELFGRASLFTREYCYFDDSGVAKNRGNCYIEMPRMPSLVGTSPREREYARQYFGTPIGKAVADPEITIIYLHTLPDVWLACNNRKAFGCTYNEGWPERVTIFVPTLDKTLDNKILNHEIEYHAKRNIEH